MLVKLVRIVIAGLVVHAAFRAGTSAITYYTFRDELQQIGQFSGDRTEEQLRARALEIARQLEVPVEADQVLVRREGEHTYIDASYTAPVEVLPAYFYPWEFRINIDAWTAR
jgi:hypothetical protein